MDWNFNRIIKRKLGSAARDDEADNYNADDSLEATAEKFPADDLSDYEEDDYTYAPQKKYVVDGIEKYDNRTQRNGEMGLSPSARTVSEMHILPMTIREPINHPTQKKFEKGDKSDGCLEILRMIQLLRLDQNYPPVFNYLMIGLHMEKHHRQSSISLSG